MRSTYSTAEGLSKVLRSLTPEATRQLRDRSVDIAGMLADEARGRARTAGGAWKYLAPTIRGTRDRVPAFAVGGSRRIPGRTGSNQSVGDLLMGTEFGGRGRPTTQQFLPHLGTTGYVFWPALRDRSEDAMAEWSDALHDALVAI